LIARRPGLFFSSKISGKVCIYFPYVELSGPVNSAILHTKGSLVAAAGALFVLFLFSSRVFAQEALLATAETTTTTPAAIAPEQSVDLTTDLNPPLPVASTDPATESVPATSVDSGIPRRFH
jgi:hypothetical protein